MPALTPLTRQRLLLALSGILLALGLALTHFLALPAAGRGFLAAAALVAGSDIARRALVGLRRRDITIELLVTIATAGALLIGEVWEAAAVTFLFTLGAFLEARTLSQTRHALGALLDLTPETATVLRGGAEEVVSPFAVALGETVVVKPGGRIPVDGEVTAGRVAVDESSITGEPLPAEKEPGAFVYTGTVSYGYLQLRATGVGADTTLARIIRRVEEAQEAKAPSQRFIERFARYYTPAMILASIIAYLVSGEVRLALTLLVISCPGALVISTPVAIVAGIGRAAQRGILLKGGEYLERTARLTATVFDKTGTLTRGQPVLSRVVALEPARVPAGADWDESGAEREVLRWAASAEMGSEHPLAKPILEASSTLRNLPYPEMFESFTGQGIRARVDGREVVVGSPALLAQFGAALSDPDAAKFAELQQHGHIAVAVAVDGTALGILGISDTVRDFAAPAVAALHRLGIGRLMMLTGDHPRTAQAVAAEVGIGEVHAGLLPEEKLEAIQRLQHAGEVVAMVGDGVNDAPALAAADVGIAMGAAGARVALETAPVVLMTDDLMRLYEAVRLARATLRVIHQNVAIALVTVVGLLAGVLVGQIHMASGMLIHQLSVLLVIANALRLRRV